ncbi:DUF1491 family protein [Emcibacter sp. SYSU 3D8]|uniref:DUF1491 family protein n=1 Tax=Emcibacter sp. SYSU 3D8 TaxID=3133969 RepID=UPI0031FF2237
MSQPRLNAKFWVQAYIRLCEISAIPAMVVRHGDDTAGTVLIKLYQHGIGSTVFERTVDMDGNRAWLRATGPDPIPDHEADAFIAKQAKFDPDLWVVEVESRDGSHLLDDPII